VFINAAAWEVDGTYCVKSRQQVNSGPYKRVVTCADNGDGRIDFSIERMPKEWKNDAATIDIVFTAIEDALVADHDTVAFDLYCQCRGDGDTLNDTWGTKYDLSITMDTADAVQVVVADDVDVSDGACADLDEFNCKLIVDTAGTTAEDIWLTGASILVPTDGIGE
jgi:hypothetical protein